MVSLHCVFIGDISNDIFKKENGFSPEYVWMWYFKVEFLENVDPQTSQENGFSPVRVCMWLFKVEWFENADPQTSE